jgi:hypothetical protein
MQRRSRRPTSTSCAGTISPDEEIFDVACGDDPLLLEDA